MRGCAFSLGSVVCYQERARFLCVQFHSGYDLFFVQSRLPCWRCLDKDGNPSRFGMFFQHADDKRTRDVGVSGSTDHVPHFRNGMSDSFIGISSVE
jgi:hypothetical protein